MDDSQAQGGERAASLPHQQRFAAGACPSEPTTVVDLTPMGAGGDPLLIRQGRGGLGVLGL